MNFIAIVHILVILAEFLLINVNANRISCA